MFGEVLDDREAIDARHHQVERDDFVVVLQHLLDRLAAIARSFDNEPVTRQDARDENADARVVIDDERAPLTSHGLLQKPRQSQQRT
ncbi:MAG TPA: hypothetical protein VII75_06350 [Thermoanaerobaculia bacterium]